MTRRTRSPARSRRPCTEPTHATVSVRRTIGRSRAPDVVIAAPPRSYPHVSRRAHGEPVRGCRNRARQRDGVRVALGLRRKRHAYPEHRVEAAALGGRLGEDDIPWLVILRGEPRLHRPHRHRDQGLTVDPHLLALARPVQELHGDAPNGTTPVRIAHSDVPVERIRCLDLGLRGRDESAARRHDGGAAPSNGRENTAGRHGRDLDVVRGPRKSHGARDGRAGRRRELRPQRCDRAWGQRARKADDAKLGRSI